jgi:hypothetical protein
MSLTNYTELKAALASWLNKTNLTASIPDFITLNEAQMRREITSVGQVETYADVEIDEDGWPLPCSAREIAAVIYDDDELPYISPDRSGEFDGLTPRHYTIIGKVLHVVPAGTVEIRIKQKLCGLSAYVRCNWVLRDHPDAYLYGSLMQAAPFLRDDERIPVWKSLRDEAIESINRVERERQTGAFLKVQAGVTP